jgi:hypothetical protein
MRWCNRPYYEAFYSQKYSANLRNIDFLLTFDEWYNFWLDSGHLHERGRRRNQYCMARFNDTGPYALGNIKIITNFENVSEGNVGKEISLYHRNKIAESNNKRFESQEARDRIAECNSKRIVSQETKNKIAASLKGRKLSEEHKQNITNGLLKVIQTPEVRESRAKACRDRIWTDESRQKISIGLKGKPRKKRKLAA